MTRPRHPAKLVHNALRYPLRLAALHMLNRSRYALPMLIMLIFANSVQALMTYAVQQEGPVATVAALLGLKPLVDGFNIIFGNEDDEGSTRYDPVTNFAISRLCEKFQSELKIYGVCGRFVNF